MAWIDYLRGIAIILVVYRHVYIGIERTGLTVPYILRQANMAFFSFRMPLFFVLSGLFISTSVSKKGIKKILEQKFELLLYPYFVWAFLQITLQIFLSKYTNAERTAIDYLYIFYQPIRLDQFWYLPALFNCSAIYLLTKFKLKLNNIVQLIIGTLLFFIGHYYNSISMISDWMQYYLYFAIGDAFANMFFQAKTQDFINKYKTLLFSIPIFAVTQYYYLYKNADVTRVEFLAISCIGCACMFVFAFHLQKWNKLSMLRVFGYHSLYIYMMHVIASAFTRFILTRILHINNATVLLGCGIFVGVLVPVILYNLILKKHAWFLFSYHSPKLKGAVV